MMSNIAEGFERGGNAEFRQFLAISKGSAAEVESQLLLALDLGFLEQKECDELISGLRQLRMLTAGLIRYLKACGMKGYRYIEPTKNR
jgi:four helix bundle protein